ncbi:MAG: KH domain-containing protein [Candidatus Micrarchaeia archaeon]
MCSEKLAMRFEGGFTDTNIVVPGELLLGKPVRMPGTYIENGKTYAELIGVWDSAKERFIPLEAIYNPMLGDGVVGIIDEEKVIGYGADLGIAYKGLILARGLRMRFSPGDIIFAEIMEISEVKDIILTRPRKLYGGKLIAVSPAKIPRIIGKKSSMIEMISRLTKCEIYVGKNGLIWLKGDNVQKAIDAILKIEKEAHISGLTDRIEKFLRS